MRFVAGVTYDRVDDEGLHIMIGDEKHTLDVDTVVLCTGQEPRRDLYADLLAAGVSVHLIGVPTSPRNWTPSGRSTRGPGSQRRCDDQSFGILNFWPGKIRSGFFTWLSWAIRW